MSHGEMREGKLRAGLPRPSQLRPIVPLGKVSRFTSGMFSPRPPDSIPSSAAKLLQVDPFDEDGLDFTDPEYANDSPRQQQTILSALVGGDSGAATVILDAGESAQRWHVDPVTPFVGEATWPNLSMLVELKTSVAFNVLTLEKAVLYRLNADGTIKPGAKKELDVNEALESGVVRTLTIAWDDDTINVVDPLAGDLLGVMFLFTATAGATSGFYETNTLDAEVVVTPGEAAGGPFEVALYGWGAVNDAQFNDIPGQVERFAGKPPYSLFFCLAASTMSQVNAWRAAFPGAVLIAYVDLYHLQYDPDPGTTYYQLVQNLGANDFWLRYVSDGFHLDANNDPVAHSANDPVIRFPAPDRGYYFWNSVSLYGVLTQWLNTIDVGGDPILEKFDGLFIDNLPWSKTTTEWQALIDNSGGDLKVNGLTMNAAALANFYNNAVSGPAGMTFYIRQSAFTKHIIRNAAAYNGAAAIACPDPAINGILWEEVENDEAATVFNPVTNGWMTPWFPFQFVRTEATWAEIQSLTWPEYVGFMQGGNMRPDGRLP